MAKGQRTNITKTISNKSYVTKKQIKSMIESREEKKVSNTVTSGTTSTAGTVNYLTIIAQGTNVSERVGDKIRVQEMTWDLGLLDSSASLTRVIIFSDLMNLGAAPAVTDVIASANYYSQLNAAATQQHRFRILYDDVITTSLGAGIAYHVGKRIKRKFPINFVGTTNGVASAGKGALFMLILSTGTTCAFDFATQILYTDS